jgi:1-acyl-sn-glycerol-3-phosphate acyltransferase
MRSVFLWTIGLIHFCMVFVIIWISLLVLPKETTYRLVGVLFGIQLRIMGVKLKVKGTENIDLSRSYLVMGNHQSLFDLFAIPVAIPICMVGIEAAYHFSLPLWGPLITRWGCIPIVRKDLARAVKSLDTARETLAKGDSIIILPEGHRTLSGKIEAFKKGPFFLALQARADILPFSFSGFYRFNNKHSWHLNPGKMVARIGKPIPYDAYKNFSVDELRDLVRNAIIDLQEMDTIA